MQNVKILIYYVVCQQVVRFVERCEQQIGNKSV